MQLSLFYDYQGILKTSSFYRKYDALFRAFEKVYDQSNHSLLGREEGTLGRRS